MKGFIEIPAGRYEKIEINEKNQYVLDRITDLAYPAHYGFLKTEKAEDGDYPDLFLISDKKYVIGSEINVELLEKCCCISLTDDGIQDDKHVYFQGQLNFKNYKIIKYTVECIISFLKLYKEKENAAQRIKISHVSPFLEILKDVQK